MKKQVIAMLLAGGQGTRLYELTSKTAKPAVSFGGKYRIIDFTLSNCAHSGIDTVGVLTQYQPLVLNRYLGTGMPWDMDRLEGGVHVLPPYQAVGSSEWYLGTANAVYQNIGFIDEYSPDYVVVLSGDHIYKMDYNRMLQEHKANQADCTIAVIEVPIEEASRFGIMNTDSTNRIVEFEEKPKQPKSNMASMGVYIFTWAKLKAYLQADAEDPNSDYDFGKNVIPAMLNAGERMFAYLFEGYWKDVGTLESLWQGNMDLLEDSQLGRDNWQIYSRPAVKPPHMIGEHGKVINSIVTEGCEIDGTVEHSVLSQSVVIEEGAYVKDSILMSGAVIKKGARVCYTIMDEGSVAGEGSMIGGDRDAGAGITVLGSGVVIADGTVVKDGERIG